VPSMPMPTTQRWSPKWTRSTIDSRSSGDEVPGALLAEGRSVACEPAGDRRLRGGRAVTSAPTGSRPEWLWRQTASRASAPREIGGGEGSDAGTASSPEPSVARTLVRSTGTHRPPRVTEPAFRPWRTARRPGGCVPFGRASAISDSSLAAVIAPSPTETALAEPLRHRRDLLHRQRPPTGRRIVGSRSIVGSSSIVVVPVSLGRLWVVPGSPWRTPDTSPPAATGRGTATYFHDDREDLGNFERRVPEERPPR